jgi:hypothetical protein
MIRGAADATTMRTTPARPGELLAEPGPPGRTLKPATEEWDPSPIDPFGPMRQQARPRRLRIGPRVAVRCDIRACVGTTAAGGPHAEPTTNRDDAADRPSTERTGSRFPAASRSTAVTPQGDRSRHSDGTACGTERFLGRGARHRRRPLPRPGSSGPDPGRRFGAAWASASADDVPGDDRCRTIPVQPERVGVERIRQTHHSDVKKSFA